MNYDRITKGRFISRPNRFIANVEIDGTTEVCHVKNTGRCKELLLPDAEVYLQKSDNPNRKTNYDLIAVQKGSRIINMDSQIPNKIFEEWAKGGGIPNLRLIKGEQRFGNSRLDFYLETIDRKMYAEVKGVTLEDNNVAMFPDAPTERGIKHLNELCSCINQGYDAMAVFIIQMSGINKFIPNDNTHKAFGDALRTAAEHGVHILALECDVTPDSIVATKEIPVKL